MEEYEWIGEFPVLVGLLIAEALVMVIFLVRAVCNLFAAGSGTDSSADRLMGSHPCPAPHTDSVPTMKNQHGGVYLGAGAIILLIILVLILLGDGH